MTHPKADRTRPVVVLEIGEDHTLTGDDVLRHYARRTCLRCGHQAEAHGHTATSAQAIVLTRFLSHHCAPVDVVTFTWRRELAGLKATWAELAPAWRGFVVVTTVAVYMVALVLMWRRLGI